MGASIAMKLLVPAAPMAAAQALPGTTAAAPGTALAVASPPAPAADTLPTGPASFAQLLAEASAPVAAAPAVTSTTAATLTAAALTTESQAVATAPPPAGTADDSTLATSPAPARPAMPALLRHLQQAMADARALIDASPLQAAATPAVPVGSGPLLPWSGDTGLPIETSDSEEPEPLADTALPPVTSAAASAAAIPAAYAAGAPPGADAGRAPASATLTPAPGRPTDAATGPSHGAHRLPATGRAALAAAAAASGVTRDAPTLADGAAPAEDGTAQPDTRTAQAAPSAGPADASLAAAGRPGAAVTTSAPPVAAAASNSASALAEQTAADEGLARTAEQAPAGEAPPLHANGAPAAPRAADAQSFTTHLRAAFEAPLSAAPGSPQFAPALGLQVSTLVRNGVPEARLHLHPAELGPIAVQIALDGNAAQVFLAADHALTRQALEQALPQLAGALRDAGFTLAGGGVSQQGASAQPGGRDSHPGAGAGPSGGASAHAPTPSDEAPQRASAAVRNGLVDLYA